MGQQPANLGQHLVEQDRLHQVVVGAALKRLDGVLDRGIGRDQQHERLGADLGAAVPAVPDRPCPATARRTGRRRSAARAARASASSPERAGDDGEALLGEVLGQGVADQRLVVDHQDRTRPGRPGAGGGFYHDAASFPPWRGAAHGIAHGRVARGRPAASGRQTRKTAPSPGRRLEIDRAAVVGDQLPRHEQAQAGAVLLGGEIRLKEPGRVLRGDAAAVVAHRHLDALARALRRRRVQLDAAVAVGGVDGVEDEVEEHLHQLVADAEQRRQVRRQRRRGDAAARSACNTWRCSGPRRGLSREGEARPFAAGRPAELDQLAQGGADALELAADQAELVQRVRIVGRGAGASAPAS